MVARVSALQAINSHLEKIVILWQPFAFIRESGRCSGTTRAAHEDLPLVFRVEIDEQLSLHESRLHADCASQPRFLVACKHTLKRSVLDVVSLQQRHFHSNADTVVCAQRRALGLQPFAVNISFNRRVLKIKIRVIRFTHHVHVALNSHHRQMFHSLGGRLSDNHVASLVHLRFQTVLTSEILKKRNHLFFML